MPTNADLPSLLRQSGWKEASLSTTINGSHVLRIGDRRVESGRMPMAVRLTRDLGLDAGEAEDLLDRAKVAFWFDAGKSAFALQVMDEPDFQVHSDQDFGIDYMVPQTFNLRTTKHTPVMPADRIGDHANINGPVKNMDHLPEQVMETASGEELSALADGLGLPTVFEHGAVAALASAHDSMRIVAKYLGKVEQGLDAMGRILFLSRWKPEDFEKAYGEDDMPMIADETEGLFTQLGDWWAKMQSRSPQNDPEHTPLNL